MRRLLVIMACVIVLTFVGKANAALWTEFGDAGNLPGTAQVTSGANPLTSISGSIGIAGDVDMYQIYLSTPALFSATTVGGSTLDTQLFLFNSSGLGVYANDDSFSTFQSTLPAGNIYSPTAPGNYYLAISGFNKDPIATGGLIFPDTFTSVVGPTGPGGSNPVNAWTVSGTSTGGYRISLTGAEFVPAPVPEPSTMLLLGSGLAGLVGYGRRRFKK